MPRVAPSSPRLASCADDDDFVGEADVREVRIAPECFTGSAMGGGPVAASHGDAMTKSVGGRQVCARAILALLLLRDGAPHRCGGGGAEGTDSTPRERDSFDQRSH